MPCPLIILSQSDYLICCWYKFTYLITNSADPDQLASSETTWSGSTLIAKVGYIPFQQDKGQTRIQTKPNSGKYINWRDNSWYIFTYIFFLHQNIPFGYSLELPQRVSIRYVLVKILINYIYSKYLDWQAWANSADPDQRPNTVCYSSSSFPTYQELEKWACSNFTTGMIRS